MRLGLVVYFFSTVCFGFQGINGSQKEIWFQEYLEPAFENLEASSTSLGRLTFYSIERGEVRIGSFRHLLKKDYMKLLKDLERFEMASPLRISDYNDLKNPRSKKRQFLDRTFAGLAWERRIYVSENFESAEELASTLVHEMNHNLNCSDQHYYGNQEETFLEEFRAYFVERIFQGASPKSKAVGRRLKKELAKDSFYNGLDLSKIPDIPKGLMVPTQEAWNKDRPKICN